MRYEGSRKSIDDILAGIDSGEIVKGNKGERITLENGDYYLTDPESNNLIYSFADGYQLTATQEKDGLSGVNVFDTEGNPLSARDDVAVITHRTQTVLANISTQH